MNASLRPYADTDRDACLAIWRAASEADRAHAQRVAATSARRPVCMHVAALPDGHVFPDRATEATAQAVIGYFAQRRG